MAFFSILHRWKMDFLFPGSFGWIFWNYPPSLSWTLNSRFECPGRRYIFHEFNPYILYQESWLSNNILNHVVCFIGKCSMCWQILLLFITHSSYDGFFSVLAIVNLLRADPSVPSFTPPLLRWSPPTMGESVLRLTTRDPLTAILWLEILITLKGITIYLTMESDKFTALYPL